jgi:hypothetical protein
MPSHDETNKIQALRLQIDILRRNLADNELSWVASGFERVRNPVADSIRRDIAEKEALLGQGWL